MAERVKIKLWRSQVGKHPDDGLDVSRKSAGPIGLPFAPPWPMVMASKRGGMPWAEYRRRYLELLDKVELASVVALRDEGLRRGGELCLTCWCSDGAQCHSTILIQWLVARWPEDFEVKRW